MKTKKLKKPIGYTQMFIRDFMLFSLLMFIMFLLMIIIGAIISFSSAELKRFSEADFMPLNDSDFESLYTKKYLGSDGFFYVLDSDGVKIYSSIDIVENFPLDIVPFLGDEKNEVSILRQSFTDAVKNNFYEINFIENNDYSQYTDKLIVDYNGKSIFSSLKDSPEVFSGDALRYIKGEIFVDYSISKLSYTANDGENYTAIFFRENYSDTVTIGERIFWPVMITFFIAAIAIPIIVFVIRLDKKVKKPVLILNQAICDFADGDMRSPVAFSGPKEFQNMCDNFNKMAAALNKIEEERAQIEKENKRILSDISHDLKTPITIIQGYSKAILDNVVSDEERKNYLEIICKRSEALTKLISQFSEYNKLNRTDFTITAIKTDICEFLRTYLIDKYTEIEFSGLALDTDICDAPLYCDIDAFQFSRILENIISNVIKYNPKGTTIFVTLSAKDSRAIISIADNGVGIDDGIRDSIFSPFVVGEISRTEKEGSGLGLTIAKKIVTLHNCKIFLAPKRDGVATEFIIEVPFSKDK